MLDMDYKILFSNPAIKNITGFSPEELINKPIGIIYGEDSVKLNYEISIAQKSGIMVSSGWRTRKNGDKYWAQIIFNPAKDKNNLCIGFSCIISDETERIKQELHLRNNEQRFRKMVEAVRDYAIFMLDPTGIIITWNEGAQRTKGYTPNEIIGKHFSTFYTAEDLNDKKPERELIIAKKTGKYEEEGWRVKKNGSLFWANVVITALYDENNQLIGFSKVTRDISEKKLNEEGLKQSEERYRSLVEQVTDYGIFMLDDKGRIVSWNEGARRMKGYEANEIIGRYFSTFYPEEDIISGKPVHELKVALKEGKYEEEGWRVRKDGSRFWANVVITPVFNSLGVHIGFSKVTRDLTERKEAEKVIRESYERYKELARQLKVTNEELMLANEELEQFTSIVSHDLQEPIRSIKSFLQLIEIKLIQGDYKELNTYITKSINAANRMRELIRNLLHYSQVGKGELIEEEINVEGLFNEVKDNLKPAIQAANTEVIFASQVEYIKGDRVQITQLLQNLISNAIKFTRSEKPRVEVGCYKEDNLIKFAVSDNGIGIEQADLKKVFDIFRRLNTVRDFPGTGIGLAICKKIVERHGGNIWPESEQGKGTTFYFTLSQKVNHKLQHEKI